MEEEVSEDIILPPPFLRFRETLMTLKELIAILEKQDPNLFVPLGFHNPQSYRGYYEDLAFEPMRDVTVGSMLKDAKKALGSTYGGYKGGDYTMGQHTRVWIAPYGRSGEEIGKLLLWYMLGGKVDLGDFLSDEW